MDLLEHFARGRERPRARCSAGLRSRRAAGGTAGRAGPTAAWPRSRWAPEAMPSPTTSSSTPSASIGPTTWCCQRSQSTTASGSSTTECGSWTPLTAPASSPSGAGPIGRSTWPWSPTANPLPPRWPCPPRASPWATEPAPPTPGSRRPAPGHHQPEPTRSSVSSHRRRHRGRHHPVGLGRGQSRRRDPRPSRGLRPCIRAARMGPVRARRGGRSRRPACLPPRRVRTSVQPARHLCVRFRDLPS